MTEYDKLVNEEHKIIQSDPELKKDINKFGIVHNNNEFD